MPERTSDLDAMLDAWTEEVVAAQPRLVPHLDEIADHLRSVVETQIAGGADVTAAFAAAIDEFGDPGEIAQEYAKSEHLPRRLFEWIMEDRHAELAVATGWVGLSAPWAAAIVGTSMLGADLTNWLLVGYAVTTFGPLTALNMKLTRKRAAASH